MFTCTTKESFKDTVQCTVQYLCKFHFGFLPAVSFLSYILYHACSIQFSVPLSYAFPDFLCPFPTLAYLLPPIVLLSMPCLLIFHRPFLICSLPFPCPFDALTLCFPCLFLTLSQPSALFSTFSVYASYCTFPLSCPTRSLPVSFHYPALIFSLSFLSAVFSISIPFPNLLPYFHNYSPIFPFYLFTFMVLSSSLTQCGDRVNF